MRPVKKIVKIQVAGAKHFVPAEDGEIEKLIQRGRKLKEKAEGIKAELETVNSRLVDIARARREGTTTVSMEGITATAIVTFRESFVVKPEIENIKVPLGPLFKRFFTKETEFKTTAEFKKFMESGHALGIDDPDKVKASIRKYVTVKEIKPNVKIEG